MARLSQEWNLSARNMRTIVRFPSEQAFARTAGVPLITGNQVRLLRDARENYSAWQAAIEAAEHYIHFESYILHEDAQGKQFADLLAAKARVGVQVRVIYDWMGGLGATSNRFWQKLRQAGVEVRCFNRLRFDSPFGWLNRDHRKMLGVDGRVAYVSGLCVGEQWVGKPERGIEPWRDTGIEVVGPAVADIEQAFAQTWNALGEALPAEEVPQDIPVAGDVNLRVIPTEPYSVGLYRLDQLIAAMAKKRLWLTDAYFVGTTTYVQALRSAALDGVDVRLLVPSANDILLLRSLSRAGYRPLLEAGVRVFEWNGPMLHAKTAVADGYWARVGSSNLNLASWIGNLELDVVIEDAQFGAQMEQMYEEDLANATEIVLNPHNHVRVIGAPHKRRRRVGNGSASRAATGAIRIGRAVGAAITNQRILGPAEARLMLWGSLLSLALSAAAFFKPRSVAWPISFLCLWTALSLLWRAYQLHRKRKTAAPEEIAAPIDKTMDAPYAKRESSSHV